jgi:phage gp36-like protein
MPSTTPIAPLASATRTADGSGSSVDLGVRTTAALDLVVTALDGTLPTLTVALQTSKDGTTWRALGAFTAVSAAGVSSKRFPGADRYLRATWALGGTDPSFTFSVEGDAVLVFATPADLYRLGVAREAIKNISDEDKDAALAAVTDVAYGYFGKNAFVLPPAQWGDDLRRAVCGVAAYDLMSVRGYAPTPGSDVNIRLRHQDAIEWFKGVSNEKIKPAHFIDATPEVYDGGAFVVSRGRRGWGGR